MSRLFSRRPDLWCLGGLMVISAVVLFYDAGGAALFEPDEGRNAEIAREIVQRRDWITPHYDFLPYLDKPIGFYALIAISYVAFGVSEWAARVPSALAALVCLLVTYDLARARAGGGAARWAGLVLVTSPLFAVFARATNFDMTLTACMTVALWAFARAIEPARRGERRWPIVMGAALGAAVLVKGPIGGVLPGLVMAAYLAWSRSWPFLRRPELLAGAGVAALLVVPWYALAEVRNPGYLRYFLYEENLLRYLTPQFEREGPWYYFLAVIPLGLLPWSPALAAVVRAGRSAFSGGTRRLLWIWIGVPVLFYSVSSSKLPGYILPVMPPIAILIGEALSRAAAATPRRGRWPIAAALAMALSMAACAAIALLVPSLTPAAAVRTEGAVALLAAVRQVVGPLAPLMVVVIGVALAASLMERPRAAAAAAGGDGLPVTFVAACAGFALLFLLTVRAEGPVSARYSSRELAAQTAALIRPGDQIVIYDAYFSSLPFYLRIERPIWVVWPSQRREVIGSPFVAAEKRRGVGPIATAVLTGPEFLDAWIRSPSRLVVVVPARRLAALIEQVGSTLVTLTVVDDTVIVANR